MAPTGATAHYAPGHPFILAGIYRVFGQGLEGEFAKHVWSCGVTSVQYALLALAGFWGVFRLCRVNRRAGLTFVATWVLYPLVYYFIHCSTRYRYPIDWTFLLLGAYATVRAAPQRFQAKLIVVC